jgi:hypothetical protein
MLTVAAVGGKHNQEVESLLAEDDVLAYGVNDLGGEITEVDEE